MYNGEEWGGEEWGAVRKNGGGGSGEEWEESVRSCTSSDTIFIHTIVLI